MALARLFSLLSEEQPWHKGNPARHRKSARATPRILPQTGPASRPPTAMPAELASASPWDARGAPSCTTSAPPTAWSGRTRQAWEEASTRPKRLSYLRSRNLNPVFLQQRHQRLGVLAVA